MRQVVAAPLVRSASSASTRSSTAAVSPGASRRSRSPRTLGTSHAPVQRISAIVRVRPPRPKRAPAVRPSASSHVAEPVHAPACQRPVASRRVPA
jgi:hypothetical protein